MTTAANPRSRLALARLAVIAIALGCIFVLWPALLLARFAAHLPVPMKLIWGVFVTGITAQGVSGLLQLAAFAQSGRWRGLDGRTYLRAERPAAFRAWATSQLVGSAIILGAAAYLTKSLVL